MSVSNPSPLYLSLLSIFWANCTAYLLVHIGINWVMFFELGNKHFETNRTDPLCFTVLYVWKRNIQKLWVLDTYSAFFLIQLSKQFKFGKAYFGTLKKWRSDYINFEMDIIISGILFMWNLWIMSKFSEGAHCPLLLLPRHCCEQFYITEAKRTA